MLNVNLYNVYIIYAYICEFINALLIQYIYISKPTMNMDAEIWSAMHNSYKNIVDPLTYEITWNRIRSVGYRI